MRDWYHLLCRKAPLSSSQIRQLAAFLRARAGRNTILKDTDIRRTAEYIKKEEPGMRRAILKDAAKAMELKVNLFGCDYDLKKIAKKYGRPGQCELIPWFHELNTGHAFYPDPLTRELAQDSEAAGFDKKHMLDLPRLQWAASLGEAHALTGQPKYARMFMRIMNDFITFVPPRGGIPWNNAMDTGIRAANMLVLWHFFRTSPALTDAFVVRFWQSMIEHLRACLEWPEDWPISPPHPMAELPHIRKVRKAGGVFRLYANHYLGGRTGVWAVLQALPDTPELAGLRKHIRTEMERELLHEVTPEGMDFEDSTHYHRLVTEMFVCWAAVCRNTKVPISEKARKRFRRMFEFVCDITKPDGRIPQVGDMDNGRMHIFGYGDWRDVRYLTQIGACFFKDTSLLAPGTVNDRYALWHFGPAAAQYTDPEHKRPLGSAVFQDTGVAVLRQGRAYAAMTALRNGQDGAGGHSHDDRLGIEYSLGKYNIITDPGQGIYLSRWDLRVFFRSIRSHSVLAVDDADVNPICPGYPWYVPDNAHARITRADALRSLVEGQHTGFKNLNSRAPYKRTICLGADGRLAVHDTVPGTGMHTLTWRWVLGPGMQPVFDRINNCVKIRDKRAVRVVLEYPGDLGLKASAENGLYALEYGKWIDTKIIKLETRRRMPREAAFLFKPV